jgi:hypothetical protein
VTSRRAVPGWDQRISRALQFVPGHVGGRVASAQPVIRRGGTLRREAVGAVGVSLWGRVLLRKSSGVGGVSGHQMIPFTQYFSEGSEGIPYDLGGLTVRLDLTLPTAPPDNSDVLFALLTSPDGDFWTPVLSWTIYGPHTGGNVFTVTYPNPANAPGEYYVLAALFPYPSEDERWSEWSAAWNADPEPQAELVYPA